MRAGKLRHRITLEYPATSQNATGEEEIVWTELPPGKFSAEVKPLRGTEQFLAGQVIGSEDTRITLRWSLNVDQVTDKWRVRFAGLIYDIREVNHIDFGQRELELMCQSGKTDG